MQIMDVDVAIVGGGPGGCAAALSLRAHAPSLSVAMIEASTYEDARLGETLPPPARRILEHLGVWAAFERQAATPLYSTAAAWGTPIAREHPFIYSTQGAGWHLDRRAFDASLAHEAEQRGVTLLRATRVRDVTPQPAAALAGWQLHLESAAASTVSPHLASSSSASTSATSARGAAHAASAPTVSAATLRARMLVDATGRAAAIGRRLGARCASTDRLTALTQFVDQREITDPRTLVETFRDGWWYTAPLPGNRRIVCCMTDADLARPLSLHEPAAWAQQLASTHHILGAVRHATPCGPLIARAVGSRQLDPAAGDGWLAVGDAASMFDPLSSQGILKALRSGIFASYAIADVLAGRDPGGVKRYAAYVRAEFAAYTRTHAKYYAEEQRWPDSAFWQRRIGLFSAENETVQPAAGR
jgi:flavin-dependent dehydrogenase